MQSIIARVNSENITIDQAAMQLGINTVWLIWERSTLVLVLIFMSGWLREHDHKAVEASTPTPMQPSISAEDMAVILARLAKVDELEQRLASVTVNPLEENGENVPLLESGVNPLQENHGKGIIASKRDDVAAALAKKPDASLQEIAQLAGCSEKTAAKHLQALQS